MRFQTAKQRRHGNCRGSVPHCNDCGKVSKFWRLLFYGCLIDGLHCYGDLWLSRQKIALGKIVRESQGLGD